VQKHGNFKEFFPHFLVISIKGIVDENIIFFKNYFTNAENPSPKFGCSRPGLFFGRMFFQLEKSECFWVLKSPNFEKRIYFLNAKFYPKLQLVTKNIEGH
jgi:hypothetical protein